MKIAYERTTKANASASAAGKRRRAHLNFVRGVEAQMLASNDPDLTFNLGEFLARVLVENTCGIYRCDAIEQAIVKFMGVPGALPPHEGSRSLHVFTETYSFGGHTRLVRLLLEASDGDDQIFVGGRTSAAEAAKHLGVDPARIVKIVADDAKAQIVAAARTIARFDRVYLSIHPADVKTASAVLLAKTMRPEIKVGFINHADHIFSTGLAAADYVFEISSYGWHLRVARGIADRASFVGIPIRRNAARPAAAAPKPYALSAGGGYKYRPQPGASLPDVMNLLLAELPELTVELIGPRAKDRWWRALKNKYGDRILFFDPMPYERYLARLTSCAFYIDSFPTAGGTAFPEALISGINVIGMKGGTWGYSCADALRVDGLSAFLTTAKSLWRNEPVALAAQERVRELAIDFHSPRGVAARIKETMETGALHELPQILDKMGRPPLLWEVNWNTRARLRLSFPAMRSLLSLQAWRIVTAVHAKCFGYLNVRTLRLLASSPDRRTRPEC